MPALYKITRQFEEQRANDAGRFVLTHVTRFMVGDDGPFEVTMPSDGFDPAANAQKIAARAASVAASRDAVNS